MSSSRLPMSQRCQVIGSVDKCYFRVSLEEDRSMRSIMYVSIEGHHTRPPAARYLILCSHFPTTIMPFLVLCYFVFGLSISSLGAAFVPIPARYPTSQQKQNVAVTPAKRSPQPLHISHGPDTSDDGGRQFAASILVSTYVLTSILTSRTAALAITTNQIPTSIPGATTTSAWTLSERSGGRMGGRSASSNRPVFRPPSRLPGSATSRQYGQAVIVRPTPVLSPGFGLVDL